MAITFTIEPHKIKDITPTQRSTWKFLLLMQLPCQANVVVSKSSAKLLVKGEQSYILEGYPKLDNEYKGLIKVFFMEEE